MAPNTMMMKAVMMVISGGLALWMGTSFVVPADLTSMAGPAVAPQHGDSHRLGAIDNERVELPRWDQNDSSEISPLLGSLAAVN